MQMMIAIVGLFENQIKVFLFKSIVNIGDLLMFHLTLKKIIGYFNALSADSWLSLFPHKLLSNILHISGLYIFFLLFITNIHLGDDNVKVFWYGPIYFTTLDNQYRYRIGQLAVLTSGVFINYNVVRGMKKAKRTQQNLQCDMGQLHKKYFSFIGSGGSKI